MISVTEYLELPAEIRRKTDLIPKPRGRYRSREVRKKWRSDPEALIEYLQEHRLDSAGKVTKHKRDHGDAPTVDDCVRFWGSWMAARDVVFGKPIIDPFTPEPTPSPMYLIKTALYYGLRTRQRWCEARKSNDLIPSIGAVRRQFKTFTKMKLCARMLSIEWGLDAYMELARKKGRLLTAAEMTAHGINLTAILSSHGNRSERNWFIRRLMKIAEQRESDRAEWDYFPREIAASEHPASV